MKKIKKISLLVFTFLLGISTKVFGISSSQPKYGVYFDPIPQPAYGVVRPIETIWKFAKIFIIPIILLIGIIIYLKKSTSTKLKKAITVLAMLIITGVLYFIIENILYY